MKGTFEGYDAYKDSGVEWLKELPSQWLYFRVKEVCEVKGRIGFRGYNKDDLVNKGEGALLIGASEMHVNGSIILNLLVGLNIMNRLKSYFVQEI
jgi:hypothetical protein